MSKDSTYPLDVENPGEMVRLLKQAQVLTEAMGGLVPEQKEEDLRPIKDVLDIGCGPGEWVLDMAFNYPEKRVMGIDISKRMIDYARDQADIQSLENTAFAVMDARKPLGFPDESFDLVNARTIAGILPSAYWPAFMKECKRLLRPGGIVRITETDQWGITNSAAYDRLFDLATETMRRSKAWQLEGRRLLCITPLLARYMEEEGFTSTAERAFHLNFSPGKPGYPSMFQNFRAFFKLIQPNMLKYTVATQEEIDEAYNHFLQEGQAADFGGITYFLTVWGRKEG